MLPQNIGRYEIKAELGRGGMATVYRAYDPRFKRDVAIKVLPHEFLHDPQFRTRFEREAETIAALEHPAIVPVHDFGEEDGQPYIVMRLMTGGSLAGRLERGPLPLGEAARIFSCLAPALDKAHAKGIIHRDLKPGNILFDADENPCISDFGIAKLIEATATFTGTGVVGTPAYISPEQARGEHSIDGRSDIYALGAIVFQMLTGKLPYEADTPMGIAIKHITEPTPHILETRPDLPRGCEDLIQKAMAKNRDERFSTASGLAEALTTVAAGAPAQPPLTPAARPPTAQVQPAFRLFRRGWIVAGVIGLAGLALGAALWLGRGPDRQVAAASPTLASTFAPSATQVATMLTPPTQTPAPTPTAPPTVTPTPTTRPTRTPTPQPAWVTDFAEPILAAIAGRTPDFQDDFSTRAGGWTPHGWCAAWRAKYVDGTLVLTSCGVERKNDWYGDFVAEVEGRFLSVDSVDFEETSWEPTWSLEFRSTDSGGDKVGIHYTGGSWGCGGGVVALPLQTNRLMVIAKGSQVACYVNGKPASFWETTTRRGYFGLMSIYTGFGEDNVASFDNFKVWDISGISLAPTPGP
jgi:serine/threonine-protein kinase